MFAYGLKAIKKRPSGEIQGVIANVLLPTERSEYERRKFLISEFSDLEAAITAALEWQELEALKHWQPSEWEMIKEGKARRVNQLRKIQAFEDAAQKTCPRGMAYIPGYGYRVQIRGREYNKPIQRNFNFAKFGHDTFATAKEYYFETATELWGKESFESSLSGDSHILGARPRSLKKRQGKLHYGIKNAAQSGSFTAYVPNVRGEDDLKNFFSYCDYGAEAYDAAVRWVERVGVETWGEKRWAHIKDGYLHRYRSKYFGVKSIAANSIIPPAPAVQAIIRRGLLNGVVMTRNLNQSIFHQRNTAA